MESPKIRFKGFTKDWEQRKLGEVLISLQNNTLSRADLSNETGIAKNVHYGDVLIKFGDVLDVSREQLPMIKDEKILDKYKASFLQNGDVIIADTAEDTTVGKCSEIAGLRDEFVLSGLHTIPYRPVEKFATGYLGYYLNSDAYHDQLIPLMQGIKVTSISKSAMKDTDIVYPKSTEEQAMIGSYFQSIDTLITLHQRKCEQTKKLKKYMLQKMFPQNGAKVPEIRFDGFTYDWEQRKLGELVISHNAGIYISKEDYGTGTNVIGVGNIYDNDIFDGEIYRLGPVNDEKFLLEENDLIYGESSLVPEGIARTVCVGKNGVGSAFAWHTRRVKLDQSVINSHFATLELNYNIDVRKYLISVSTQTALTGMTTEGYFGVTLSLPTVGEQAHISSLFKQLDHLITLHQRKCDKLKKMKKYMLQNMFI